jgi:hypothetical protein
MLPSAVLRDRRRSGGVKFAKFCAILLLVSRVSRRQALLKAWCAKSIRWAEKLRVYISNCPGIQLLGEKPSHGRVCELAIRGGKMGELTISELLIYGLTCTAIPALCFGAVYVFYSSYKANQRVSTLKNTADESMEISQRELHLMEEVVTLQRETNALLREIVAKVEQGAQRNDN